MQLPTAVICSQYILVVLKLPTTYIISQIFYSVWKTVRIRLQSSVFIPIVRQPAVIDDDILVARIQVSIFYHFVRNAPNQMIAAKSIYEIEISARKSRALINCTLCNLLDLDYSRYCSEIFPKTAIPSEELRPTHCPNLKFALRKASKRKLNTIISLSF